MIPPSAGNNGVNTNYGGGWPQYDFTASPEEVAAAEKALQAEFQAASQSNDPYATPNWEIGNATPEQVAQAQAALEASQGSQRC